MDNKIGNSYVSCSLGSFCWSFFPTPNPKKHRAKIGETPTRGAAIPLYSPKKPCSEWKIFSKLMYVSRKFRQSK